VPVDLEAIRAMSVETARAELGRAVERAGWFVEGEGERFVLGLSANIEAHWIAQKTYELKAYPGDVIMIRAPERVAYKGGLVEPSWDWSPYCGGAYKVHAIRAPHSKMIYPPYVGELARLLGRLLDGADVAPNPVP